MKYANRFAIPLLVLAVMALFAVSHAADKLGPYQLLTTITVPGNLAGGFDISWVDSASERYYLSDRTTGSVDVVDAENDQYLFSIGGFQGVQPVPRTSGPDGVLVIHKEHELWAGDGDSTAKVVDLNNPSAAPFAIKTFNSCSTSTHRADELAYDPIHHIILIANDADTPPYVTFISQESRTVLGGICYPQAVFPDTPGGPAVNHGMEQPVWNQQTKKFYISVPATSTNVNGEVDEIDPKSMMVTRVFPINTPCGPAGLALLPKQRLMTSCGVVLNVKTGGTLATIQNVGGDEIWFNSGDDRVYFGGQPMGVVDAFNYQVITSLPVGNTHSVAVNPVNNHIFVPVRPDPVTGGGGIQVWAENTE
jgi:hypothetical protein